MSAQGGQVQDAVRGGNREASRVRPTHESESGKGYISQTNQKVMNTTKVNYLTYLATYDIV
jgi:hypothetical protein